MFWQQSFNCLLFIVVMILLFIIYTYVISVTQLYISNVHTFSNHIVGYTCLKLEKGSHVWIFPYLVFFKSCVYSNLIRPNETVIV